ncbi:hypothetical protein A3E04_00185 [Candidatus Kuenenbacteria bacterium RIFCSPHIGHO2_12_FULL_42_14]|uniref:Uncharacterized protein n=1 Tax=Candidatus Kuenenbacteria bacterium RIFCSPHIGHO2_12_FULL_42_14 TaxID=1798563 RepID=A0A1F6GK19_9BACT|nr:MAG: hypothetical protein A3E04_00185 [Candidatus Kuenenbacteria bacterium RIFCSPHIGHO2_12_FULL_42_14]
MSSSPASLLQSGREEKGRGQYIARLSFSGLTGESRQRIKELMKLKWECLNIKVQIACPLASALSAADKSESVVH